jgi:3-isopropylmalate/(R)-2-methylmalate dehydratase small subunit
MVIPRILTLTSAAFYLPEKSMDTDRIIPADFLKMEDPARFIGLGKNVFRSDRDKAAGAHPFDQPENKGRSFLIADANFGSGSSREHAVPALMEWGIKAIIAPSFAPIFAGNAVGNGLVCIETLSAEDHALIVRQANAGSSLTIDLEKKIIKIPEASGPGFEIDFDMPEGTRIKLVTGRWHTLATCLEGVPAVQAIEDRIPKAVLAEA